MTHSDSVVSLIIENDIKIFAEIGVHKARTCRVILRDKRCFSILEQYWVIDNWNNSSSDNWHNMYLGVCKYMLYFSQMRVLKLLSEEACLLFPKHYFDMVYIDANHRYKPVQQDIKAWLPLVKPGGIISGHDYGSEKWTEVKSAVDDLLEVQLLPALVWWHKVNI